jgi:hypothetical protein
MYAPEGIIGTASGISAGQYVFNAVERHGGPLIIPPPAQRMIPLGGSKGHGFTSK